MTKGFGTEVKTTQNQKGYTADKTKINSLQEIQANLFNLIEEIPDPRMERTQKHIFKDILVIAILAVIAGAKGWEDMENYGIAKQEWLKEFLALPSGIPSDDTFRRVFERIEPQALEKCLQSWIKSCLGDVEKEVIPIDGKCLRGSYDRNQGIKALHTVTAWASEQKLVLAQVRVESKSNEITAIPALLELLDITGAIITLDAMGTQTEIVKLIRQKKADYIVSLKANHPTLYQQVQQWFTHYKAENFQGIEYDYHQQLETAHHRTEKRCVWAFPLEVMGGLYQQEKWSGLKTIVVVERTRRLWNQTQHEIQFYFSSLPADAIVLGRAIRQHWRIENQVHWILDVTWREDQCRIRLGHSPANFALLRRIALNILNQETTFRRSLIQKSKQAAMNNNYMIKVLHSFCQA
jgi:predicted transposase YbfD/YdcC